VNLRFAACTLDTDAHTLVRDGAEVHLSPKAFELLSVLAANRPRALAKDELLQRVWPGVFVSDDSLAKVVSQIRKALGDGGTSPILRTVHGYGYAFAAAAAENGVESLDPRRAALCWLFCGTREFPLSDGEHIVGREPDADICLDSPQVSRRHARVVVAGTRATIEDLGSKNGSFVGGVRISGPTPLQSGDEASIGPFRLLFRVAPESASTQTAV
jgi:DNA-binding winged helix-turn-helix (wHTH) protein